MEMSSSGTFSAAPSSSASAFTPNNGGNNGGNNGNNGGNSGPGSSDSSPGQLRRADLDRFFGSLAAPITFANKAAVTINLNGGNDFLSVNAPTAAAGLTSLTVNGGDGFDVVTVRSLAQSLTASFPQVERVVTALDQVFVEELYQLRLGRASEEAGMTNWLNALKSQGRRGVLNGILGSDEAMGFIVNDLYVKLLGRPADQAGQQNFVTFLRNGGSIEQLITSIALSSEFQTRAATLFPSGTTPQQQVIGALYLTLLERQPTAQELSNAAASVTQSGLSAVINGIVRSSEFRRLEVASLYETFFNRVPDVAGLNGWLNSNLNLLDIRSGLMASDEFFGS